MISIEKAKKENCEEICLFLKDFNDTHHDEGYYKGLFIDHWQKDEDHCGYMLICEGKVVGFMGLIFSRRKIDDENHRFCNITSWVVKDEYRKYSLMLFGKLLELKGYNLTNFTPTKKVCMIMEKAGFKELESEEGLILPPILRSGKTDVLIEFEHSKIKGLLDEDDQKIFMDHADLNCVFACVRSVNGYCLIIMSKTTRKKMPLLKVHYISNAVILKECVNFAAREICLHFKRLGLLVDKRYLQKSVIKPFINFKLGVPQLFKSDVLTADNIDSLYSELQILKI